MPTYFQYNAKSMFLTYAQCPITREHMFTLLKAKIEEPNQILKAAIGQEKH